MSELKFEDCIVKIDEELRRQSHKWTVSLPHLGYEDVSQIIRNHIHAKWHQYKQTMSLGPWVARIISTQIKNLMRNNFASFAKPCHNCPFSEREESDGTGGCMITPDGTQCNDCPLFARWAASKKDKYNIHVPVSMDASAHTLASESIVDNKTSFDFESSVAKMHDAMKKNLNAKLFKAYTMIYIDSSTDAEVAKFMGYKSNEKERKAGYKQIRNLRERFLKLAKELIKTEDILF